MRAPDEDNRQEADAEPPGAEAESLERLQRGEIPLAAERRLRGLAERGGSFTSDLSVSDFALCDQLGLRPLSQVMGSSIFQVGYQSMPWPSMFGETFMFELDALSQAWNEVRGRALGRLAQEARHAGADAVIGVRLRTGEHAWAENSIEYVVLGTAVRAARRDAPRPEPVLTELSVADYAKLAQAGIEPLGVVAWSSVFFVAASYATQGFGGVGFARNQELGEFTQGVYSARETVVARLTAQAARLSASGVIGVRIGHQIKRATVGGGRYAQGGLIITFHAIGNAIREAAGAQVKEPRTIVDLTTNPTAVPARSDWSG
jgi:uncharacterized protein YbjQ (UPF0145 family)